MHAGEETKQELRKVLNKAWQEGIFPKEWRTGRIKPIYKKGDKEKVENYRGITLMDSGYKLYAEILRERLEKELEERGKLDDTQYGFRKGRGSIDAVYVVKKGIKEEIQKEKGKIWAMFGDMKAAFDKLKREKIWKRLEEAGVSYKLRKRIEEMYKDTRCEIMIGDEKVGEFRTKEGVRQGCPLSPALFNVVFANLEKEIRKAQESGIRIGRKKIYSIAYADDIILLANNETGLKEVMRKFKTFIEKIGLELNVEK